MAPVFAVLISLLFFGLQPLAEQLVGSAVVLAGVLCRKGQRAHGADGSDVLKRRVTLSPNTAAGLGCTG